MIEMILAPLGHAFMLRGFLAAVMVGTVCAVLGAYVVLRGMAFFGDALAHAILPGVAIGYLVGGGARGPLFWWALVTAIFSALGIGAISRATKVKEDTAIGIVFAGMFALGVALISTVRSYTADLAHFLFGDVLGVRTEDIWLIAIFGGLILLLIIAFYKEFLVLSFDPLLAETLRLPARLLDYLLIILIAVAIVVSLQTVGIALMVAIDETPAGDDGAGSSDRFAFGCGGIVFVVLYEYRLWRGGGVGVHSAVWGGMERAGGEEGCRFCSQRYTERGKTEFFVLGVPT